MEIYLFLIILLTTIILFVTERFPVDLVAFIILGLLLLLSLISPEEAISGFSNPATITVAAMFVLSAALEKTGCLTAVGKLFIALGKRTHVLLFTAMLAVGIASAFVNNTAVIAVFLPIALHAATTHRISPSLILMPMSFASQAGGVCTLIGSSTNLIVSAASDRAGLGQFSMFELAQLGAILLIACILYFALIGRFLLPKRHGEQLTKTYQLGDYVSELVVSVNSPLIGYSPRDAKFVTHYHVKVIKLIRNNRSISKPTYEKLQQDDLLLVEGKIQHIMELKNAEGLEIAPEFIVKDENLKGDDVTLVEAIVLPGSRLIGRTLKELDFYQRYNFAAIALQRKGKTVYVKIPDTPLQIGDSLLLQGLKSDLLKLRRSKNFAVLEEVDETVTFKKKAPIVIAVVAGVIIIASLQIMPIVASALIGAVLLVLTGCLTMEDTYEAIDWRVIFLLGGMIPLGIAMEKTGTAGWLVSSTMHYLIDWGPLAILATLYLITTLLTETMSNNASAILLAPIGISLANQLHVNPKTFLIAIAFAASTSFLTPVGYQTNTMVYSPGGYQYLDYLKVGLPLNLLFWGLSIFFIPYFWPL